MTPDRSHSDTVGRVTNKVRVEGESHLQPLLLRSEISLGPKYRSSDALPVPEIYIIILFNLLTILPQHHIFSTIFHHIFTNIFLIYKVLFDTEFPILV